VSFAIRVHVAENEVQIKFACNERVSDHQFGEVFVAYEEGCG